MKQFLKIVFGSALGFVLANIALFFLIIVFFITLAAAGGSGNSREFRLKDNSVFHLKLSGEIVDRSHRDIYVDIISGNTTRATGLDEILSGIRKAKENKNIKGILIEADYAQIGISSAREIREALMDFKESGKFVIAQGGAYTQTLYYISSVADKIVLNPAGSIELKGLASRPVFYKGALDKLGIEMQLIKVGTYKSYAEQYTNTEMSEENREQISAYINSIWGTMLTEISESRNISAGTLNHYANEMMTFQPAEKAVSYKLIDKLLYTDEIDELLAEEMGVESDEISYVKLENMKNISYSKKPGKEKIALVYAIGSIDGGGFDNNYIQSDKLAETLKEIREDESIEAVVLRVNSPGGSAYGSEQIWREVALLKEEKPVVVSMGDYAASGGYYIACAADAIVAQPTTLTGSIGIFGIIPNTKGLTDKIGITYDIVKTNEKADMPSLSRSFTEKERDLLQMYINQGYELFVKRCADGRNMSIDSIKSIAEGRVWTGKDAKNIGLVDELGGLEDAIELAKEKAYLTSYRVIEYPAKKDFMTEFLSSLEEGAYNKIMKKQLGENYIHYQRLQEIQQVGKIQAALPFDIVVE